jgi:outer membrane protein
MFRSWRTACAVSALTAALFAVGTPAPASAQEAAFKPKSAGDLNVRLRAGAVVPTERGDVKTAAGGAHG